MSQKFSLSLCFLDCFWKTFCNAITLCLKWQRWRPRCSRSVWCHCWQRLDPSLRAIFGQRNSLWLPGHGNTQSRPDEVCLRFLFCIFTNMFCFLLIGRVCTRAYLNSRSVLPRLRSKEAFTDCTRLRKNFSKRSTWLDERRWINPKIIFTFPFKLSYFQLWTIFCNYQHSCSQQSYKNLSFYFNYHSVFLTNNEIWIKIWFYINNIKIWWQNFSRFLIHFTNSFEWILFVCLQAWIKVPEMKIKIASSNVVHHWYHERVGRMVNKWNRLITIIIFTSVQMLLGVPTKSNLIITSMMKSDWEFWVGTCHLRIIQYLRVPTKESSIQKRTLRKQK